MVNNWWNINQQRKFQWWSTIGRISTNKESLNSDGQQFHKYQQNKESLNSDGQQGRISTNKESLNSDGQQFQKYQPSKKV